MFIRDTYAVCEICGTEYRIKPSRLEKSRYCSRACQDAGRSGYVPSKEDLERLYYDEKLSMQQMADRLGCHFNKVVYWMRQYGIERRSRSDATTTWYHPDGDPFEIRMPSTFEGWRLFGMGIALYMGEGTKTRSDTVALSNSNPNIHRIFIRFLEEICGLSKDNLSLTLHLYPDLDIEGTTEWWAGQLGVSVEQFTKPFIHEGKKGNYKKKAGHGTLQVRFYNTRLFNINHALV